MIGAGSQSLQALLRPRSVAVVGASDRPGSVGGRIVRNMVDAGFDGTLAAVGLHGSEVAGIPIVRSHACGTPAAETCT